MVTYFQLSFIYKTDAAENPAFQADDDISANGVTKEKVDVNVQSDVPEPSEG